MYFSKAVRQWNIVNGAYNVLFVADHELLIFSGKNYEFWAIKMKNLFCSQGIWDESILSQDEKDKLQDNMKKDDFFEWT